MVWFDRRSAQKVVGVEQGLGCMRGPGAAGSKASANVTWLTLARVFFQKMEAEVMLVGRLERALRIMNGSVRDSKGD